MTDQKMIECPECHGKGTVEYSTPAHQAWSPDQGTHIADEEIRKDTCEKCGGSGEVEDDEE